MPGPPAPGEATAWRALFSREFPHAEPELHLLEAGLALEKIGETPGIDEAACAELIQRARGVVQEWKRRGQRCRRTLRRGAVGA